MEQTNKPFRLRFNLFDLLVLVVILAVGLFALWTMFRPEPEAAGTDRARAVTGTRQIHYVDSGQHLL